MRKNLNPPGVERLIYEIREIVKSGKEIEKLGKTIRWENIGDPIAKGEKIPTWMKDILKKVVDIDASWGYSPTSGIQSTVNYLIQRQNNRPTSQVKLKDGDILFFNGLGDAVATIYSRLAKDSRIILPSPCYSAHALGESDHAQTINIFYKMDPLNDWQPDIAHLTAQVKAHPNVVGILLINPDNPTGAVHSRQNMESIVKIAKEFKLFIIADEIYQNLAFGESKFTPMIDVIGSVPAISMQGMSKEVPWPGSRCGWIEVYNKENDADFNFYFQRILDCKMSQVCSTTMPQMALPEILEHPLYESFLKERRKLLVYKTDFLFNLLKEIPQVIVNKPQGALYFTVVFNKEKMNNRQEIEIDNPKIKSIVEQQVKNQPLDKRFVYYLLGSKGICVVPLSGFFTELVGFRMTLLETNLQLFEETAIEIANGIKEYFSSAN